MPDTTQILPAPFQLSALWWDPSNVWNILPLELVGLTQQWSGIIEDSPNTRTDDGGDRLVSVEVS